MIQNNKIDRYKFNLVKLYLYSSVILYPVNVLFNLNIKFLYLTIVFFFLYLIKSNINSIFVRIKKIKIYFIFLILFISINFLSAIKSDYVLHSLGTVIDLIARLIFLLIMLDGVKQRKEFLQLFNFFIIFFFLHYFILIYEQFTHNYFIRNAGVGYEIRNIGFFIDPNFLAKQYLLLYPISFYLILKRYKKILNFLFLSGGIVLIYTTGSKSALILYLLSLILSIIPLLFKSKNYLIKSSLLFISIIIIFIFSYYPNLPYKFLAFNRLNREINRTQNEVTTFSWRQRKWEAGMNMFRDNIILGIGPEMFPLKFSVYTYLHNSYLDILIESGLIAFTILCILLFLVIKDVFVLYIKTNDIYFYYIMIAYIIILLSNVSLSGGFVRDLYMYFLFSVLFFEKNKVLNEQ